MYHYSSQSCIYVVGQFTQYIESSLQSHHPVVRQYTAAVSSAEYTATGQLEGNCCSNI